MLDRGTQKLNDKRLLIKPGETKNKIYISVFLCESVAFSQAPTFKAEK